MTLKFHRVALLALPFVIAAIAAPGALATEFPTARQVAMHEGRLGTPWTAATLQFPTARQIALHEGRLGAPSPPSNEARVASNAGFSWANAGIGAGAAFALTMIGLGGLLVLSNRRHRAEQPAPTA